MLVYGSICLVIFIMSLSATFLPVISDYVTEKWVINTAKVMELMVLISILLISVLVYHIYRTNERLKNAYGVEKNLKQTQAVYYETLLRKEQETRNFRHDLSGHFVYISNLAKQAQTHDIIDYMKKMTDNLEKISKIGFHTGNLILDTMLSYYTSDLGRGVSVKVTGMLDYELVADEMQLCTIFSNVLKNVTEELYEIKEEQKHLHVFLRCGSENAVIQMENTSRPKKMEGDKFLTSKKDKKNHGIGIKNIMKALDMCGGFCSFGYKNGEFITEIYIPHKGNDL